ncbi:MAG: DUF4921 family protein, partial [Planctomycetota bacterium]
VAGMLRRTGNRFRCAIGCTGLVARRDLLTGDWTVLAPTREQRPNDFSSDQAGTPDGASEPVAGPPQHARDIDPFCPFCCGSESATPSAVWSVSLDSNKSPNPNVTTRVSHPMTKIVAGEQDNWEVRVVPNKFPAVAPQSLSEDDAETAGLFPARSLAGGHEVVIESSAHAERVTEADASLVYLMLLAYRERIRYWRSVEGIQYISVFKNCGPAAGASLRHSHSQIVATSVLPFRVKSSLLRCETHRARTGCSLGCDLIRGELQEGARVITVADSFVAFCPFASRVPGLIRISSLTHVKHFDEFSESDLDHLASFLWRALRWVDQAYPGKAYNMVLNTCPPRSKASEAFQWSLDLFPRLNKVAGFEWSSDCMINPVLPETAAEMYRETAALDDPRRVLSNA